MKSKKAKKSNAKKLGRVKGQGQATKPPGEGGMFMFSRAGTLLDMPIPTDPRACLQVETEEERVRMKKRHPDSCTHAHIGVCIIAPPPANGVRPFLVEHTHPHNYSSAHPHVYKLNDPSWACSIAYGWHHHVLVPLCPHTDTMSEEEKERHMKDVHTHFHIPPRANGGKGD